MPESSDADALVPATLPDAVLDAVFEPDAETATSTATATTAAPSTAPRRVTRRRRVAAEANAASRSTRSRRAASRSSLRFGWALLGMVDPLEGGIGGSRARRLRGDYGRTGGTPAISGRRRSREDRGERAIRRSGGRRAGR